MILLKDEALRYVFANRFFLGQRPDDVVGRTQREVFSGGLGFAWTRATDDRDARVLQTGQGTGFRVVRVPGAMRERVPSADAPLPAALTARCSAAAP